MLMLKLRVGDGPEVLEYDMKPLCFMEQQNNKSYVAST